MASSLPLKVEGFNFKRNSAKMNNVCICCTSQNDLSTKFSSCKHTRFLTNYLKPEIDLKNAYICNTCHDMLKIIEVFIHQVEGSMSSLLKQVPKQKHFNVPIVGQPTHTNFATKSEIVITSVKSEATKQECLQVDQIETDVKFEQDSSDDDTDRKAGFKKECSEDESYVIVLNKFSDKDAERELKRTKNEHEGKVKLVMLTEKELQEERASMAQSDEYLKKPYKCEDCIVGFTQELSLINHKETKHMKIENGFQCNVCKTMFSDKIAYQKHTNIHFKRSDCMVCQKRFKDMSYALQHYNKFHVPDWEAIKKSYTCDECGYNTMSPRTLRYHKETHRQKQICNICGNLYVTRNALKVHMNTMHGESPQQYKCDQCNKSYGSKSGIEKHKRAEHSATDMQAYCIACKKYFRNAESLKNHLKTHSRHISENDKRFICDDCGARFVAKRTLQAHISWEHFRINMNSCTQCTKVFRSPHALTRHVQYAHNNKTQPRNKICHYCGRAFTTQLRLQAHIRTHTGERPLQCPHCPSTFAHSATLYNHKKLLHTPK